MGEGGGTQTDLEMASDEMSKFLKYFFLLWQKQFVEISYLEGALAPMSPNWLICVRLGDLRQIGRFVPDWAIFNALDEIFVVQIVTNVATK